jgi:hypothetical protein
MGLRMIGIASFISPAPLAGAFFFGVRQLPTHERLLASQKEGSGDDASLKLFLRRPLVYKSVYSHIPKVGQTGMTGMSNGIGKPEPSIRRHVRACVGLRNERIAKNLRGRLRPIVLDDYACRCDKADTGA